MKAQHCLWVIISAVTCVACQPYRADYYYIELSGTDVTVTETGKPDNIAVTIDDSADSIRLQLDQRSVAKTFVAGSRLVLPRSATVVVTG